MTSHQFTAAQLADAANEVAAQLIAEGVAPDVAARAAGVAAVNAAGEQVAEFAHVQHGLLPAGTVTRFGLIVATTLTSYKVAGGSFVPFDKVHGKPRPVAPLVVFG